MSSTGIKFATIQGSVTATACLSTGSCILVPLTTALCYHNVEGHNIANIVTKIETFSFKKRVHIQNLERVMNLMLLWNLFRVSPATSSLYFREKLKSLVSK